MAIPTLKIWRENGIIITTRLSIPNLIALSPGLSATTQPVRNYKLTARGEAETLPIMFVRPAMKLAASIKTEIQWHAANADTKKCGTCGC